MMAIEHFTTNWNNTRKEHPCHRKAGAPFRIVSIIGYFGDDVCKHVRGEIEGIGAQLTCWSSFDFVPFFAKELGESEKFPELSWIQGGKKTAL